MEAILSAIMMVELLLSAFVVIPFDWGLRAGVLNWLSKQEWVKHLKWGIATVALFSLVVCAGAIRDLRHYTDLQKSAENFTPAYRERQLEAERDRYLAGFNFVMLLLLHRACSLMLEHHLLGIKHFALERQSKASAQFLQTMVNNEPERPNNQPERPKATKKEEPKPSEDKSMDKSTPDKKSTDKSTDGEGDKEKEYLSRELERAEKRAVALDKKLVELETEKDTSVKKLEAEAEKAQEKQKLAEQQLQAIKDQAASQQDEYMRLLDENKRLHNQMEDYVMILGDSKKKKE